MTTRVLVNGASGRMGQLAVKTLAADPNFTLVGELGRKDDLATAIKNTKASIVVDLTNAEVVYKNTHTIIEMGAHPVIGTSGLQLKEIEVLQKFSLQKKIGGIIAPNFSIGAVLMMKYAKEIARYFSEVEIIEMHHNGKLDSPSGTAIRSAELIAEGRTTSPKELPNKETVKGARGASYQHIPVHSVRLPGLVAHQQIIFGGTGETLTLRHDSIDRQCFMPGIILCCKKVLELHDLVYGMENIL